MQEARHRYAPASQPGADPVCLLDKEWAARREEPPGAFLALASSQETFEDGATFHFAAVPGMWERIGVFVAEEQECCPFFAFEQWDEADTIALRITRAQP
jgi:hypothetical protein